jgi:hypothetical protein
MSNKKLTKKENLEDLRGNCKNSKKLIKKIMQPK